MFGKQYDGITTESTTKDTLSIVSDNNTVKAEEAVVAPDTKNDTGLTISVTGTPEVAGTITTTINAQNIFLAKGTYDQMVKVNNVTAANFDEFTNLYVSETVTYNYTPVTEYVEGTTKYYYNENVFTAVADNTTISGSFASDYASYYTQNDNGDFTVKDGNKYVQVKETDKYNETTPYFTKQTNIASVTIAAEDANTEPYKTNFSNGIYSTLSIKTDSNASTTIHQ